MLRRHFASTPSKSSSKSLREMLHVYAESHGGRQPARRARYCRRQGDSAPRTAPASRARSPATAPEKKCQKEEMAQWMLVWLENPEVFPRGWKRARRVAAPATSFLAEPLCGEIDGLQHKPRTPAYMALIVSPDQT